MREMMKKYKWQAVFSSVMILAPMLAGVTLWNRIPAHGAGLWGGSTAGEKAILFLPLILLAVHWICLYFTFADARNRSQTKRAYTIIFWIVPVISVLAATTAGLSVMKRHADAGIILPALLGILFIVTGNSMPKFKQNSTVGIKVKWTLENEENWYHTHRFTAKIWVLAGFLMLGIGLLPRGWQGNAMIFALILLTAVPVLYSWRYARGQKKNGTYTVSAQYLPASKNKAAKYFVVPLLIFLAVILFTGEIRFQPQEDALEVKASYYSDLSVPYEKIESMEYREAFEAGIRTNGFGSPRLMMGSFSNDEFGSYTLYAYTGADSCIVIESGERVLVLGGKTAQETKQLYETLKAKTGL